MRPLQILLVEDNLGDVRLVQLALEEHRLEHTLQVVGDGEAAIQVVCQLGKPSGVPCPDLMLLDLNLPRASGLDVLSEFRQHRECTHVPVIVVTSSSAAQERAQMQALGISRYFQKPLDFDQFMQLGLVVKEVVEAGRKSGWNTGRRGEEVG